MSADDTQTDTTNAATESAQQNQAAAVADPNGAETSSSVGANAAAVNIPAQIEPTFGQRAEDLIEEVEAEFRDLWEETEMDADEIVAWFKEKLNPKA